MDNTHDPIQQPTAMDEKEQIEHIDHVEHAKDSNGSESLETGVPSPDLAYEKKIMYFHPPDFVRSCCMTDYCAAIR